MLYGVLAEQIMILATRSWLLSDCSPWIALSNCSPRLLPRIALPDCSPRIALPHCSPRIALPHCSPRFLSPDFSQFFYTCEDLPRESKRNNSPSKCANILIRLRRQVLVTPRFTLLKAIRTNMAADAGALVVAEVADVAIANVAFAFALWCFALLLLLLCRCFCFSFAIALPLLLLCRCPSLPKLPKPPSARFKKPESKLKDPAMQK